MGRMPVCSGDPNGNRTRVFGVRGRRPRPLDDGTGMWLGNQDSNLDNQIQSLAYCRCTIPHYVGLLKKARLLRCATSSVTAAYITVRLIPSDLRALHTHLFEQPVARLQKVHPA